jgi:hypothetical protein
MVGCSAEKAIDNPMLQCTATDRAMQLGFLVAFNLIGKRDFSTLLQS